jgi:hypothetical protein
MSLQEVKKRLRKYGCSVVADDGAHTKWGCPCEEHSASVPRHAVLSPGVVRDIGNRMACLPKGWLQ